MHRPFYFRRSFCPALKCKRPFRSGPTARPARSARKSNDIPTLTPYLPDATNATGAAMVICPGGAYVHLAPHEGNDYALWLNQHGVTCFVLKYRLGSSGYHYPAEFQDVTRADALGAGARGGLQD